MFDRGYRLLGCNEKTFQLISFSSNDAEEFVSLA